MQIFNKNTYFGVLFISISLAGSALADEDPLSPMYQMDLAEPKTNLAATPLAGKFIRYGYHTFWEVNKKKGVRGAPAKMVHDIFFYENGECGVCQDS